MSESLIWIIISAVSLAFSALFSGTEIAFVTSDRIRTEIDNKRGGMISRMVNRFYSNSEFFISTILVGNNIMLVVYGMGAAALIEPWLYNTCGLNNEFLILLFQTLISTAIILLAGEFIPKTIFRINPNNSLRVFALPVYIFYILLYPVSTFSAWLSKILMRLFGVKGENTRLELLSVTDLNDYLEETIDNLQERQKTVENEVKIFQNALDFSHTHLRDCMLPRNEIVAVDFDTPREQLSKLFTSSGRSKIIVYRQDIDTIVGYIHVSELFDPDADWREHIKPVLYAPETLLANKMMRRLLSEKRSIAIVVDEFGGTAGMVTLEDLVEEIFGDIQDEHDKGALTLRALAQDVYEISGRYEISELNDRLHLDIPEDEQYQTLAGYILFSTGSIPSQGDVIELDGLKMEIMKKSASRIELIRLTKIPTNT
ncbi:MAG: hemolysin family protein [Muribaculaceae bacterium]|nr:hemolysin family protein [Muribaculaceae bacterium]